MKNYFFLTIIVLCVIRVLHAGMVIATPCSNYASNYSIGAVTFCASSHASGNLIAIDGYYANTISDRICSCIVRSYKSQTFTLRKPSVNNNFIPEVPNGCGSTVSVSHSSGTFILNCQHYGSANVTENEIITLVLEKKKEPKDTRYCLILGHEQASFDVSCSSQNTVASEEITTVSKTSPTKTQAQTSVSSIIFTLSTTDLTINSSSTTVTSSEKASVRSTLLDENSNVVYIGIGVGCGVVLIVLVIVLIVIFNRCRKESAKHDECAPSDLQNQDDEEGLKYNVLYLPSTDYRTENNIKNGKRISYDIEETCHTVAADFADETSTISETNVSVKSPSNVKQSLKPDIAPKPKKVFVKHVIAPGDSGSEYAIVQKTKNNNEAATESIVTKNVYTVVDKTERPSKTDKIASDACLTDNTYAVVNKNKKKLPYKNGTEKENKCLSLSRDNEKVNEMYAKNDERKPTGNTGETDEFVVSKENRKAK